MNAKDNLISDFYVNLDRGPVQKIGIESFPVEKIFLIRKIFSAGILRFAGWWSIFAGVLAVSNVCPVCGSTVCPVGIGITGIVAVFFAAVKQWGGTVVKSVLSILHPD